MTPDGSATAKAPVKRQARCPRLEDLVDDENLLEKARVTIEQGATGSIFGRNMWQWPLDEALGLTDRIETPLRKFPG